MESDENLTAFVGKANVITDVANVFDDIASHLNVVKLGLRGDFSRKDDQIRRTKRFTSDSRTGVLGQNGVKYTVRDLIRNLIRMPHTY